MDNDTPGLNMAWLEAGRDYQEWDYIIPTSERMAARQAVSRIAAHHLECIEQLRWSQTKVDEAFKHFPNIWDDMEEGD